MQDIQQMIVQILNELDPYEDINIEQDLIETEVLDSLAIVFLVTRLEDKLNIIIEEKDITPDNFRTIITIEGLIKEKV